MDEEAVGAKTKHSAESGEKSSDLLDIFLINPTISTQILSLYLIDYQQVSSHGKDQEEGSLWPGQELHY